MAVRRQRSAGRGLCQQTDATESARDGLSECLPAQRSSAHRRHPCHGRVAVVGPNRHRCGAVRSCIAWFAMERSGVTGRAESGGRMPHGGIVIHRGTLLADESCLVGGIPVTAPARTAFDLGRRKGLTAAAIRLDALANVTGLTPEAVGALAERHPGARGLVQLRRVIELMDGGAESPQESRTRLLGGVEGRRGVRRRAALDRSGAADR